MAAGDRGKITIEQGHHPERLDGDVKAAKTQSQSMVAQQLATTKAVPP